MQKQIPFLAVAAIALLLAPTCTPAQGDTGRAADVAAIHKLLERYAKAVDSIDSHELSEIWSHSAEVSFVYPLGEEKGFDAIKKHVFEDVMGGMFSSRDLQPQKADVHVNGNAAWAEFHWIFHATMRKDGSAVTTHGVETQIYRRGNGTWRLVHVHYSEDPQTTAAQ
jgi:ketosteroid isomerase-like protein